MKKSSLFILMAVMVLSLLMPKEALAADFSDVKKGSSHYDGIHWLTEQGINGYEDGTFRPYEELSREHAAVIFTKVLELNKPDEQFAANEFQDVASNSMYAEEIGAVAKAGILTGKPDGNFDPEKKLSREQMATTLVRALNLKSTGVQESVNMQGVSASHRSSVQVLADLKITTVPDDFKPLNAVTRGHFATFLYRSEEGSESAKKIVKKNYNYTFQTMLNKQMKLPTGPQTSNGVKWVDASKRFTAYYLNPNNFNEDNDGFYQFLKLSGSSGVSAKELNQSVLNGKGILSGEGNSFKQASKKHNVNDVYLISHALLESGHGTSTLSRGVEVGQNKYGKPVRVTNNNRKNLKNIKKAYNMYGIGAVDSNALNGGSERAYKEGWFTPEKAIVGGAAFIGEKYISKGQDTLYKMRWNPDNPATHQYATDAGWAVKQTRRIKEMYKDLDGYVMEFEVPVYKKQPKVSSMPKGSAKYKSNAAAKVRISSFNENPKQHKEEVSPDIIIERNDIRIP